MERDIANDRLRGNRLPLTAIIVRKEAIVPSLLFVRLAMKHFATSLSALLVLLATSFLSAAEPNGDFFFKKGGGIVFLGDSITEQYQYSSYIELYLTTRFQKWNLTSPVAGIGGDAATGGTL